MIGVGLVAGLILGSLAVLGYLYLQRRAQERADTKARAKVIRDLNGK